jgi:hypothetical protein
MKRVAAVLFFIICFLCAYAQKVQTIAPKQVVAGNAFQVQYIIAEPSETINVVAPRFDNLTLVSGPNYYRGNSLVNGKTQTIENITYTLVASKEGEVKINPLTVRLKNDEEEKSAEVILKVVPQPKASFNVLSTYTDINLYVPSSKTDLDKLIEANLFIKTEVDKRICFLGEVITATFKLYSRLQSTSEVIKAPSLYGFSVTDMLDIKEAHHAIETINGKVFNTSVLRKLQLYPSQTGKLIIDEMELRNSIEFDDSATGKKMAVEKLLASDPVNIIVKSLPKQPDGFTGAVGTFSIEANLEPATIAANAQGKLTLLIKGKGNFIQLAPPTINWPKGFDVFDPVIKEELNKNAIPTEGSQKYVFSFASDVVGRYTVPPVKFSFFDVVSRKYKEVSTDSLTLEVIPSNANDHGGKEKHLIPSLGRFPVYTVLGVMVLILAAIVYWKSKKQKTIQVLKDETPDYYKQFEDISSGKLNDKQLCIEIQKLLLEAKKNQDLSNDQNHDLQSIYNDCEFLIYSDVSLEGKRDELLKRTAILLKQIRA